MDLLKRMLDRVMQIEPSFTEQKAARIEKELRKEFGGEKCRIYKRIPPEVLAERVRLRFDGRNAGQVAHELGIHRATVYRVIRRG